MATRTEKIADLELSTNVLNCYAEEIKSGNALILVSTEYGQGMTDYLRVSITYTDKAGLTQVASLTWSVGKQFGFRIKTRNGYNILAISGYGYSKANEIALYLARFYGVESVRYELV